MGLRGTQGMASGLADDRTDTPPHEGVPDTATTRPDRHPTGLGLVLVSVGVLTFSVTFPATQLALTSFGAWTTGVGRAVVAAVIAGSILTLRRVPPPRGVPVLRSLVLVSIGIVIGFPACTALALEHVGSAHAAVVTGLLPLATAYVSFLRGEERLGGVFWAASLAGAAVVVLYTLRGGPGAIGIGDAWLALSIVLGGIGYAEGGRLARVIPGWQVIAWALVLSLPVTMLITAVALFFNPVESVQPSALAGLLYVSIFSMFLGFCAWYPGLARAGVARGSQVQLLQPLLTVAWVALLLNGSGIDAVTLVTSAVVVVCVAVAQWQRFHRTRTEDPTTMRKLG